MGSFSTTEFVAALARPRRILVMVKAGPAVYEVLEELAGHLDQGDLLIDGGNEFFADTSKVASYVISGWQISTVYQFQSGAPIGFGNVIYNGNIGDIALSGDQRSPQRWFNNTGFVAARTSNSSAPAAIAHATCTSVTPSITPPTCMM